MTPFFQQDGISLYHGDALKVLSALPDAIARTCVTSPPYFGLRDYGVEGQIGLEPTPAEYVAKMVEVFRQVRRVLADDGTCWVNIGDSYNAYNGGAGPSSKLSKTQSAARPQLASGFGLRVDTLKPKDLLMIPARFAIAMQEDGWYLRSEIIWAKPAPMPESVTDRPTRAHEMVYLFAKRERYFYDRVAARDPLKPSSVSRLGQDIDQQLGSDRANGGAKTNGRMKASRFGGSKAEVNDQTRLASGNEWRQDPAAGANWRDVWSIAHEGFNGSHFAVMPKALAERCILAGSAPGDVVLDPFNGSGTTGQSAQQHGRRYVGIDLNRDYLEMTTKRFVQRVLFAPTHDDNDSRKAVTL